MDWYDATEKYHEQTFSHDGRLSSLPEEWQRELAAIWRLEADVNNGAYLQFLSNWGRESYVYASQALNKIGARKMAEIIDRCQALVDEHFTSEGASREQMQNLMPDPVIGHDGEIVQELGSILPDSVVERINELSYEFMNYPDDVATLGLKYYRPYVEGVQAWRTPTAIGMAAAIGLGVGFFLYASAAPFGPVLIGWIVALAGALVVPGSLCILATHRYVVVGLAYAAGVGGATVVAALIAPRGDPDWRKLPLQFAIVFTIVGLVSLIGSGLCALLKWEDTQARERVEPGE